MKMYINFFQFPVLLMSRWEKKYEKNAIIMSGLRDKRKKKYRAEGNNGNYNNPARDYTEGWLIFNHRI